MIKKRHQKNKRFFLISLIILVSIFLTAPAAAEAQASMDRAERYLIGPNDILNIFVWKEAELTQDVTVMPDGRISFPLIGEIIAQGKTVSELKEEITKNLKSFISAPEVTVIITESRSRIIYALGKLTRPGPYPLVQDMTVLQAITTAGGFAEWADEKNILIIRREMGKETQIRFNYKEFISGKNPQQNILLKLNDTIVVP